MKRIFCLETEWDQTVHDLKKKPTVQNILTFMENAENIPFLFRQVATQSDFDYYMKHLYNKSYDAYDMIYLCFHGSCNTIWFANKDNCNLLDFAKKNAGVFKNRNVHFGSCSTMHMNEKDIIEFKRETGARMLSGYRKDVKFTESFIFELWLLNAINKHPLYGASRIESLAEKEMPYHYKKFSFVAY